MVSGVLALAAAAADDRSRWTALDTAGELAFAVAVAVDCSQTRWALENGRREMNPLLGARPSPGHLAAACVGAVVGHALVSRALPRPYRRAWQAVTLAGELGAVGWNFSVGARLAF